MSSPVASQRGGDLAVQCVCSDGTRVLLGMALDARVSDLRSDVESYIRSRDPSGVARRVLSIRDSSGGPGFERPIEIRLRDIPRWTNASHVLTILVFWDDILPKRMSSAEGDHRE